MQENENPGKIGVAVDAAVGYLEPLLKEATLVIYNYRCVACWNIRATRACEGPNRRLILEFPMGEEVLS